MWYSQAYKKDEIEGDGSLFIATWLPKEAYVALDHINNLDDDLHMTIIYSDNSVNSPVERQKVLDAVEYVCSVTQPIKCQLTEIGIMGNEENSKVINITVDGGAKFYSDLVKKIENILDKGLKLDYDFLPHCTVNFKSKSKTINIDDLRKFKWKMEEITVQFGDDKSKKYKFKLGE